MFQTNGQTQYGRSKDEQELDRDETEPVEGVGNLTMEEVQTSTAKLKKGKVPGVCELCSRGQNTNDMDALN